jgi:hypothetical protein
VSVTEEETVLPACTYDLLAYGRPASWGSRQLNCNPDDEYTYDYCWFPDFYDATKTGRYGYPPVDYALINAPSTIVCQSTLDPDPATGEVFGAGSWCGMSTLARDAERTLGPACFPMTCNEKGQVLVTVNGETKTCDSPTLTFDGYRGELTCPNASLLCGMIDYTNFKPTPAPTNLPTPTPCQGRQLMVASPSGWIRSFEIGLDAEPTTIDGWLAAAELGGELYLLWPGTVSVSDETQVLMHASALSCEQVRVDFDLTGLKDATSYIRIGLYADPYWASDGNKEDPASDIQDVVLDWHKSLWLKTQDIRVSAEPEFSNIYAGQWEDQELDLLWLDTPGSTRADVVAAGWQEIKLMAGETKRFSLTFVTSGPSRAVGLRQNAEVATKVRAIGGVACATTLVAGLAITVGWNIHKKRASREAGVSEV